MENTIKFNECLKEWEKFELYVAKTLKEKYWINLSKNSDKMWVDLIWDIWTMEVKMDTKIDETWNHFVEVYYNNAPSGILKYDCDYYCIGTYDRFYVFEKKYFIQRILIAWRRKRWWDWNKSIGYTISRNILNKLKHKYIF